MFLALPGFAKAATPTISDVAGTLATGQALTISGMNMVQEDKTNWDSYFTSHANAYGFEGSSPVSDGYVYVADDGPTGYVSDIKLLGNKSFHFNVPAHVPADGNNVMAYYYYMMGANTTTDMWYRYYVRYHAASNIWFDNYIKQLYVMGQNPPGGSDYINFNGTSGGSGLPSGGSYWDGDPNRYFNFPSQLQNDRWYLMEVHMRQIPVPLAEVWFDNKKVLTSAPVTTTKIPWLVLFGIPNAKSAPAGLNVDCWWDGLVNSTSRIYPASIVEVSGDGMTWKYQEPIALSDTSSQIKLDLTGLTGTNYQLRVTNNQQETSTVYNLTGAQDTTPPSAPSGLSVM